MTSYAAYEAGYTAGFNLGRPLSGPEIEAWNRQAARGWHSSLSADWDWPGKAAA